MEPRDHTRVAVAKDLAIMAHAAVNHLYDGQAYSVHLEQVVGIGEHFLYEVEEVRDHAMIRVALWCHDLIEDCRFTYNDLASRVGAAADIVYDVTNELGRNRKERAARTYPKVAANRLAVYVKCCDRLANTRYSRNTGSTMYRKYWQEYPAFRAALRRDGEYPHLWAALDEENEFSEERKG